MRSPRVHLNTAFSFVSFRRITISISSSSGLSQPVRSSPRSSLAAAFAETPARDLIFCRLLVFLNIRNPLILKVRPCTVLITPCYGATENQQHGGNCQAHTNPCRLSFLPACTVALGRGLTFRPRGRDLCILLEPLAMPLSPPQLNRQMSFPFGTSAP